MSDVLLILKIMKIKTSAFLLVASITVINFSCSKDRIQKTPMNSYDANSTNSYMDSKEEHEQEFEITSDSAGTITGNQGTSTPWVGRACLEKLNGDTAAVTLPYTVKLVELYTPKQMIYYRMPTVAAGTILRTDGEIRLRAFKGTDELKLASTSCTVPVFMPNAAPQSGMEVYYGAAASTYWQNNIGVGVTPFAATTTPSNGYQASIAKLGWINCGVLGGSTSNSNLSFSSTTDDLTNVAIFVYFPATKSVMQVYSLNSGSIPNGSAVKIVCIGVQSSGSLFSYTQNLTVNASQAITVTMAATTDANLTATLNAL
jgi:hypothetical protein